MQGVSTDHATSSSRLAAMPALFTSKLALRLERGSAFALSNTWRQVAGKDAAPAIKTAKAELATCVATINRVTRRATVFSMIGPSRNKPTSPLATHGADDQHGQRSATDLIDVRVESSAPGLI